MANPVNPYPPLPRPATQPNNVTLLDFDVQLSRSLILYLGDFARRINATLPKDGTEAMTGPLDMGGFDIINTAFEERGLWTPTVGFSSPGDLAVSYAVQQGEFSRVGSLGFVNFSLRFTPTFTTSGGLFTIGDSPLPAAVANTYAAGGGPISNMGAAGWVFPVGGEAPMIQFTRSTSFPDKFLISAAGSPSINFGPSNLTSGVEHTLVASVIFNTGTDYA